MTLQEQLVDLFTYVCPWLGFSSLFADNDNGFHMIIFFQDIWKAASEQIPHICQSPHVFIIYNVFLLSQNSR